MTVTFQPLTCQQMLPGIASLSLPLPTPSSSQTALSNAAAASLSTHMHAAPSDPQQQQQGCWVLSTPPVTVMAARPSSMHPVAPQAPPGTNLGWQPVVGAAGSSQQPMAAAPDQSSAALLASMLEQLQQHSGSQALQQQRREQEWSAAMMMQNMRARVSPHAGAMQHQAAAPCQMDPQMMLVPVRNQSTSSQDANTSILVSMLQQIQQHGSRPQVMMKHQHQHQNQHEWPTGLMRQGVKSEPLGALLTPHNLPPAFMSPQATATPRGQDSSAGRPSDSCSSRSSASSMTMGASASRGSPSNSLSTLLACNEMLKSQLQENELRIQHCQERAKTGSCDNDSNDGTDDDSSNGASSVSNASTTPCTNAKEPESAAQSRYWTEEEHHKFVEAVRCFGAHNHKAIASYVTTRNSTQVRSHSQKFFKKLETFRGRGLPTMLRKRKAAEPK